MQLVRRWRLWEGKRNSSLVRRWKHQSISNTRSNFVILANFLVNPTLSHHSEDHSNFFLQQKIKPHDLKPLFVGLTMDSLLVISNGPFFSSVNSPSPLLCHTPHPPSVVRPYPHPLLLHRAPSSPSPLLYCTPTLPSPLDL